MKKYEEPKLETLFFAVVDVLEGSVPGFDGEWDWEEGFDL